MRAQGNRALELARLSRERELHLRRLAEVEMRPKKPGNSSVPLRAGAGPPRPWTEKPHPKAGARRPTSSHVTPHSGPKLTFEQQEHRRHVASLYTKLQGVAIGTEWRKRSNMRVRWRPAGAGLRRSGAPKVQAQTKKETELYYRRLRNTGARFASPSAIALLTGKPPPGAAGSEPGEAEKRQKGDVISSR